MRARRTTGFHPSPASGHVEQRQRQRQATADQLKSRTLASWQFRVAVLLLVAASGAFGYMVYSLLQTTRRTTMTPAGKLVRDEAEVAEFWATYQQKKGAFPQVASKKVVMAGGNGLFSGKERNVKRCADRCLDAPTCTGFSWSDRNKRCVTVSGDFRMAPDPLSAVFLNTDRIRERGAATVERMLEQQQQQFEAEAPAGVATAMKNGQNVEVKVHAIGGGGAGGLGATG